MNLLSKGLFVALTFAMFAPSAVASSPIPVTEPGTLALLGIGLAGVVGLAIRRRKRK